MLGAPRSPAGCGGLCIAALAATAVAALLQASAPAPSPPPAAGRAHPPPGRGRYVAVATRLGRRLDPLWSARGGHYVSDGRATVTEVNSDLLLVGAVAARSGAHSSVRDRGRARAIVRWLTGPAVWREGTDPGWVAGPGSADGHPVFRTEAVDGLVHAYIARRELGLPERSVALIRARIRRLADGPAFRWPALRLNQINWYVRVLAARAVVDHRPALLARGLQRHLDRFLDGVGPRRGTAGNLGPGLRFHYAPHRGLDRPINLDSAEYANIVLSFTRHYAAARAAGMPRPSPARLGLLRAWVRRALAGYWTHAGYLNWDTGLGFGRWHQTKKVTLAQQALIGIASAPELQPGPEWGRWAHWMLDRGLAWYERLSKRACGVPAGLAFGVDEIPVSRGSAQLATARAAANAALAAEAGLAREPAIRPPALYAYDPDIGRLAVTTPAYNTAIIAVNQRAFPYGGIELARLFDGRQDVAANIGGRPPAAFGLVVRRRRRGVVLATQRGRAMLPRRGAPLELTRAPSGVGVNAASAARRAYAGPFTDLRTRGTLRRDGITATSRYRFTPDRIDGRWRVVNGSRTIMTVAAHFPSWGRRASVIAELADGRRVPLGRTPLPLARIRALSVRSQASGYRIVPLATPRGARALLVPTRPQASAPRAGPTVAVALGGVPPGASVRLAVRMTIGGAGRG